MVSQKSYLINAIYEWCTDNEFTPYLVVMVDKNCMVPTQYVKNNQIVLDISMSSTKDLVMDKKWISFRATFGGVVHDIAIPISNALGIFARENGQGLEFQVEPFIDEPAPRKTSGLKLVK